MTEELKRESRKSKKQRKTRKLRFWLSLSLLSFLILGMLGLAGGIGYAYFLIQDTPEFNPKVFANLASTTTVYDRNGELLGSMQTDGNRELIKNLDEVSPFVVQAFIAAEDKNFYSHHGINPMAIARAAYQNFIGGGIVSGASTITQQTVKNVIFPAQEQTIKRKVQEIYLAFKVEQVMTKEEILTHYFNWIYFGKSGQANIYGIQAASKAFFGKPAKELNLAQSALLAALPNNPSKYNFYTSLDKALEYQDYVLQEMLQSNLISQEQYQEARSFDIQASIRKPQVTATGYGNYPFVIAEVEERAAEQLMTVAKYDNLDDARQALFKGGYKVYTTIDKKLQDSVDQVLANNNNFYTKPLNYTAKDGKKVENAIQQAGASLIENKTGAILAIGGGRDYKQNQNNHTTLPRQPGSTMKPIAVYAPAMELKKLSPGSVIDDVPTPLANASAAGGKYYPMNHDHQFHGLITVRDALLQSYNIPAIKTTEMISPKVGLDYVKKMGAQHLQQSDEHLVAGIGGLAFGMTVEEATSAYSTFANAGVWKQPQLITRIVDRNGKTVFEYKPKERQVFSPQTAFVMTDLMKDIVRRGTASSIGYHFPGRQIAGKTGTTDETTDSWFIGYTPSVTLGIWVGYDIPYGMSDLSPTDSSGLRSLNLWSQIMDRLYPVIAANDGSFPPMPSGIVQKEVCTKSGDIPTDLCRALGTVKTDYFIAGTEPKEACDVMVKAKYVEINGKKYLVSDKLTGLNLEVKEGIFIKREPYTLPNGDERYKPKDADLELPKEYGKDANPSVLPAPSGLQASSTDKSIALRWNQVDKAEGYLLLRSQTPTGPFSPVTDILKSTEYTDQTVQTGTVYYYQVAAVLNQSVQTPSAPIQATAGGNGLTAPTGLSATILPGSISVAWQPATGATEYVLYRSEDGKNYEELVTLKGTSYQDVTAGGENVWYKVTAKNSSGATATSIPVKAGNGTVALPPAAPVVTLTPAGTGKLQLSWSPISGAVSYKIERKTNLAWEEIAEVKSASYTDTNLDSNQNYSYRVRAIDANSQSSEPSNVVSGKP